MGRGIVIPLPNFCTTVYHPVQVVKYPIFEWVGVRREEKKVAK